MKNITKKQIITKEAVNLFMIFPRTLAKLSKVRVNKIAKKILTPIAGIPKYGCTPRKIELTSANIQVMKTNKKDIIGEIESPRYARDLCLPPVHSIRNEIISDIKKRPIRVGTI